MTEPANTNRPLVQVTLGQSVTTFLDEPIKEFEDQVAVWSDRPGDNCYYILLDRYPNKALNIKWEHGEGIDQVLYHNFKERYSLNFHRGRVLLWGNEARNPTIYAPKEIQSVQHRYDAYSQLARGVLARIVDAIKNDLKGQATDKRKGSITHVPVVPSKRSTPPIPYMPDVPKEMIDMINRVRSTPTPDTSIIYTDPNGNKFKVDFYTDFEDKRVSLVEIETIGKKGKSHHQYKIWRNAIKLEHQVLITAFILANKKPKPAADQDGFPPPGEVEKAF